jgi:hypothetical protein
MKSIKTNPNSARRPDKGKIVNKLYCIYLLTLPTQVSGILFKDKGSNGTILFYSRSKEPVKMINMTL